MYIKSVQVLGTEKCHRQLLLADSGSILSGEAASGSFHAMGAEGGSLWEETHIAHFINSLMQITKIQVPT